MVAIVPDLIVFLETPADLFMPFYHFLVWRRREGFPRDDFGKRAAIRVGHVPSTDRVLQVSSMFVRTQQELDGLPSHEAHRQQCGDRRRFEGVGGRLERVEAAQRLVDEG